MKNFLIVPNIAIHLLSTSEGYTPHIYEDFRMNPFISQAEQYTNLRSALNY